MTPSSSMASLISYPAQKSPGAVFERRTYTVTEAAKLLGISRSTAYECVRSGELQSLRFRSRIVIPARAIAVLLATNDRPAGE